MGSGTGSGELTIQALRQQLVPYAAPDMPVVAWQLGITFLPYLALWLALIFLVEHGYHFGWIALLLVLAALFLVRIFIILHDCAHGSLFTVSRANTLCGYLAGVLTFTPFVYWRHNHLVHHSTYADLDHRGLGDIWTLTVEEYRAASPLKRLAYRLYRHPLVFLGIGPGYSFLITQRFLHQWEGKNERASAAITNLAIAMIIWLAGTTIGLKTYVLIQLPTILLAGAIGVWMFYVQHQFAGVYWSRHAEWDPVKAALRGSSYYRLPRLLQWFTGNIGLHHIHHAQPRIPFYKLPQCYAETPVMQEVMPLTVRGSFASLFLNLWDEKRNKLISFRSLRDNPQP